MTMHLSFQGETHHDLILQVRSWLAEQPLGLGSTLKQYAEHDLELAQQMAFKRGYETALREQSCAEHRRGPDPHDYPQAACDPDFAEASTANDAAGRKLQDTIDRVERKKW